MAELDSLHETWCVLENGARNDSLPKYITMDLVERLKSDLVHPIGSLDFTSATTINSHHLESAFCLSLTTILSIVTTGWRVVV